jgi:hypothetical protein
LPLGSVEFLISGAAKPYFESKSGFGGAFYALQIPDAGWGGYGGEGARLSIKLTLSTTLDLRDIMGYLHEKFGLSSNGMFSIKQTSSCWHGVGAENFLQAVENWKQRYTQSQSEVFHHSEEFTYFDQFGNGWIELSSQQRVNWGSRDASRASFLHQSELVIQLPGVPVDASSFVKLCEHTGNKWANFDYIGQRWTSTIELKKAVTLNVIGTVVNRELVSGDNSNQERVVIGIVAKNPFYGKKSLPAELSKSDISPLHELNQTDLLICSLRDWYEDGDMVDRYSLQGFDVTLGGVGQVVRPFGTWNKMLKRRRGQIAKKLRDP